MLCMQRNNNNNIPSTTMSKTLVQKKWRIQDDLDNSDDSILKPCLGSELTKWKTPSMAACKVIVKAMASHPEPIQDLLLSTSARFNVLSSKLW